MDGLELHGGDLKNIAAEMKNEAENMRSALEDSTKEIQGIPNSYSGSGSQAFMENYNSTLKPKFDDTCDKIIRIADFIISSVEKYEQADTESAQSAGNIGA